MRWWMAALALTAALALPALADPPDRSPVRVKVFSSPLLPQTIQVCPPGGSMPPPIPVVGGYAEIDPDLLTSGQVTVRLRRAGFRIPELHYSGPDILAGLRLPPDRSVVELPRFVAQVIFRTEPSPATIEYREMPGGPWIGLGRSGESTPVDLPRVFPVGPRTTREELARASVDVRFRFPGYRDTEATFRLDSLEPPLPLDDPDSDRAAHHWPPSGQSALRLEPTIPLVSPLLLLASRHPWATLALAILACGLAVAAGSRLGRLYRDSRRGQLVEEAKARSQASWIGERLGDYLLVECLGRGGMAAVYRGLPFASLDEREARAVKILNLERVGPQREEFDKRFRREIEVMRKLLHRSIVFLDTYGEHGGTLYLVMELVRGTVLRNHMVGAMPVEEALPLLRQIFEGVAFAHEQGVCHRDLKPENIMVTEDGQVKIMDFGLARSHHFPTVTMSGAVCGTPAYMAPEQIMGTAIDARADQYALGVVAYELLSGRRPFEEEGPGLLFQHLQAVPPGIRQFMPELPQELEAALSRMLSKDPQDRFSDLAAALQGLESALRARAKEGSR